MKTEKTMFWALVAAVCAWLWVAGAPEAAAKTFGEMFTAAGTDLFRTSGFFSWLCWALAVVLAICGLASFVKAAKHPQQGGVMAGIVMVAVGGAIFMLPTVINAVQGTFGGSSSEALTAPTLR